MNLQDINTEWQRLNAERTPGPWEAKFWEEYPGDSEITSGDCRVADALFEEDAAAIVFAVNNFSELLEMAEANARILKKRFDKRENELLEALAHATERRKKAEAENRKLIARELTREAEELGLYHDDA